MLRRGEAARQAPPPELPPPSPGGSNSSSSSSQGLVGPDLVFVDISKAASSSLAPVGSSGMAMTPIPGAAGDTLPNPLPPLLVAV
jgi:hypothetical protein